MTMVSEVIDTMESILKDHGPKFDSLDLSKIEFSEEELKRVRGLCKQINEKIGMVSIKLDLMKMGVDLNNPLENLTKIVSAIDRLWNKPSDDDGENVYQDLSKDPNPRLLTTKVEALENLKEAKAWSFLDGIGIAQIGLSPSKEIIISERFRDFLEQTQPRNSNGVFHPLKFFHTSNVDKTFEIPLNDHLMATFDKNVAFLLIPESMIRELGIPYGAGDEQWVIWELDPEGKIKS